MNNNIDIKSTAPIIYSYNKVTGEYIPEDKTTCQYSPREDKWLIPAYATTIQPPITKEHEMAVWDFANKNWTIKANYRNEMYWDTETKEQHEIKELGIEPLSNWTQKEPTDSESVWDNELNDWILPFEILVKRKRDEIWNTGDTLLNTVKLKFTQSEIESWPKQEQGAKDISAGNIDTDSAKFVIDIAAQRGIETKTLVIKILHNVEYWSELSAKIIGEQQRLDDLIKQAENNQDKEALEEIVWTYNPLG